MFSFHAYSLLISKAIYNVFSPVSTHSPIPIEHKILGGGFWCGKGGKLDLDLDQMRQGIGIELTY